MLIEMIDVFGNDRRQLETITRVLRELRHSENNLVCLVFVRRGPVRSSPLYRCARFRFSSLSSSTGSLKGSDPV
jgi:hypothetical protein